MSAGAENGIRALPAGDAFPGDTERGPPAAGFRAADFADEYSIVPPIVSAPADENLCNGLRRRKTRATDPLQLRPTRFLHPAPLPPPSNGDRLLLNYTGAPLNFDECVAVFEWADLPGLVAFSRMQRWMAKAERRFGFFFAGSLLHFFAVFPLLAAVWIGHGSAGSASAFGTACAAIAVGYLWWPTLAWGHSSLVSARKFSAPDDPNLEMFGMSVLALFWSRTEGDRGGKGPGTVFAHRAEEDPFAVLEPLLEPEEGRDGHLQNEVVSTTRSPSPSCPCADCSGIFPGGGWTVMANFAATYAALAVLQALQVWFVFWNLWPAGSLLWTTVWVPIVLALHILGWITSIVTGSGRVSFVVVEVLWRLLGRVHVRLATAVTDAFVAECLDRIEAFFGEKHQMGSKPAEPAEEDPTSPPPIEETAPLYARLAQDLRRTYLTTAVSASYASIPLLVALATLAAALLCSFPFGGSCFPAWAFLIAHFNLWTAGVNIATLARVNEAGTAAAAAYADAAERVGSAIAEFAARAGRENRTEGFAQLLAELTAHRDALARVGAGMPKSRMLGIEVTKSTIRGGLVAAVTVGAALFNSFGLKPRLATFCPGS
ncbi:hypothetical protein DFJ74DRAFT_694504 [Hyaloraphidium curvatum]|nr:hypothetical protein DFJ74DRAFT_694504 [Hyaloraphidium curvatum]